MGQGGRGGGGGGERTKTQNFHVTKLWGTIRCILALAKLYIDSSFTMLQPFPSPSLPTTQLRFKHIK